MIVIVVVTGQQCKEMTAEQSEATETGLGTDPDSKHRQIHQWEDDCCPEPKPADCFFGRLLSVGKGALSALAGSCGYRYHSRLDASRRGEAFHRLLTVCLSQRPIPTYNSQSVGVNSPSKTTKRVIQRFFTTR